MVLKYWEDTSVYRMKKLINASLDYDYMSDYAALKHRDGHQLVILMKKLLF